MNDYRALLVWGLMGGRQAVVLPWQGDIFDLYAAGEEELQEVVKHTLEHPNNLELLHNSKPTVPFQDDHACVCVISSTGWEPDVIASYRLVRREKGYRLELHTLAARLGVQGKWLSTYGIHCPEQVIGWQTLYKSKP